MKRASMICLLLVSAAVCGFPYSNMIGFRVGATLGWAHGDDWDLIKDSVEAELASEGIHVKASDYVGVGPTADFFIDLRAARSLSVQAEIAYDQYSAAMSVGALHLVERYQVLEIPVLIKLWPGRGFAVFAGAVGVLRFGDLIEVASNPYDWDSTTEPADGYADLMYGALAGIELSAEVGHGGALGVLDVRYVHMLSPIIDSGPPATNDFFLSGVSMSVGMAFPVGRERY